MAMQCGTWNSPGAYPVFPQALMNCPSFEYLTIRLFARNVTDRRAYIGGGLGVDADNVPYGIDLNALQPRTVGISVDVGF